MTPMPGSLVSTRSIFCAASSVPSATVTWPACRERPMPTPPPWWNDTQVAPEAADARGEPLEGHPFAGHGDPLAQPLVVREQLEDRLVGGGDVGWVARQ